MCANLEISLSFLRRENGSKNGEKIAFFKYDKISPLILQKVCKFGNKSPQKNPKVCK